MPDLSIVQKIAVWVIPVLLAITLHEAAHAWVAYRLGDTTAKQAGRLSFNPFKHLDLWGSLFIPLLILFLSHFSFVFGWAKPVPIDASQFKKPRRDVALATAAGPFSNLIMAVIWMACFKLMLLINPEKSVITLFILLSAQAGIIINLVLAFLNLIPIPPLDGSKIVASILPFKQARQYEKIEPYGFFILLILMFSGILSWLISTPVNWTLVLLSSLFNVF